MEKWPRSWSWLQQNLWRPGEVEENMNQLLAKNYIAAF